MNDARRRAVDLGGVLASLGVALTTRAPAPLRRAFTLRRQILYLAALLVISMLAAHWADQRYYSWDVAGVMEKSLALVDSGKFVYSGQPVFADLTLGPLAHLLGVAPLLVSRDPHVFFYFASLLLLIAVVIYYFACRQLDATGDFAALATVIFAAVMLNRGMKVTPDNTAFGPPFFALFFWLLTRPPGHEARTQAGLWACIGLCMQAHLAAALLAPAALAARRPRDRREWLGAAVGLAALLAMHLHLASQLWSMIHAPGLYGWLGGGPGRAMPWAHYFLGHAAGPFLMLGVGTPIAALLSLVDWRAPAFRARFRPLARALAVYYAGVVLLLPGLNVLRSPQRILIYYHHPSIVLWAPLAAYFVVSSLAAGVSPRRRAAGAATWAILFFSLILYCVGSLAANPSSQAVRYFAVSKLDTQIYVATRLYNVIAREGLRDVEVVSYFYGDDARGRKEIEYTPNWRTLAQYLRPDLLDRLALDPSHRRATVHVVTRPAPPVPPSASADCPGARTLDRFRAGELYVALCLTTGDLLKAPTSRIVEAEGPNAAAIERPQ